MSRLDRTILVLVSIGCISAFVGSFAAASQGNAVAAFCAFGSAAAGSFTAYWLARAWRLEALSAPSSKKEGER